MEPWVPPWLFFFLHVHLARVSSSLLVNLLTAWLTASLSVLPPSPAAPSTASPQFRRAVVTVLMTPRATSHPPWHSTASRRRFTCALVRNVSRHATLFRWLRQQPSRCVVCSTLSSLARSASPRARLSELTLLNSPQHAPPRGAGGLLVLQQRRLHPLHAQRVWRSLTPPPALS